MLSGDRDIYVEVVEEQREHNAVNISLLHLLLCMLQYASGIQTFTFHFFGKFIFLSSYILLKCSKFSGQSGLRILLLDLISSSPPSSCTALIEVYRKIQMSPFFLSTASKAVTKHLVIDAPLWDFPALWTLAMTCELYESWISNVQRMGNPFGW